MLVDCAPTVALVAEKAAISNAEKVTEVGNSTPLADRCIAPEETVGILNDFFCLRVVPMTEYRTTSGVGVVIGEDGMGEMGVGFVAECTAPVGFRQIVTNQAVFDERGSARPTRDARPIFIVLGCTVGVSVLNRHSVSMAEVPGEAVSTW